MYTEYKNNYSNRKLLQSLDPINSSPTEGLKMEITAVENTIFFSKLNTLRYCLDMMILRNIFDSCLGNPMDREAWWATVHGVAKSQT